MSVARIAGILLIVAGGLGLLYGGFSFTKETHTAQVGPLVLKVQEKESVTIPVVLSGAAIALGLFLLVGLRNK